MFWHRARTGCANLLKLLRAATTQEIVIHE